MTIDWNWKEDSEYLLLKKGWDMERFHFIRRRIWVKRLTNRPIKWRLRTYIRIKPVIRWKRYV
jgi:hypothetical protein